jgi:hypothetical protein
MCTRVFLNIRLFLNMRFGWTLATRVTAGSVNFSTGPVVHLLKAMVSANNTRMSLLGRFSNSDSNRTIKFWVIFETFSRLVDGEFEHAVFEVDVVA